jgi:hypothetical protein
MTTYLIIYILLLPLKQCILGSVGIVKMLWARRLMDRVFTSCKGKRYVPSQKLSDWMWVTLDRHVKVETDYFLGDKAAGA